MGFKVPADTASSAVSYRHMQHLRLVRQSASLNLHMKLIRYLHAGYCQAGFKWAH